MSQDQPAVYAVIINTAAWKLTAECLESLLKSDYPDLRIIVCDNNVAPEPLERLLAWARGEEALEEADVGQAQRRLAFPPAPKPLEPAVLERAEAEAGEGGGAKIVFIRNRANLGFAGGNNVGLRHALARGDMGHAWLLNNDAVAEPEALGRMVEAMRAAPGAGMCGCKVLIYHEPGTVEVVCGYSFDMFSARVNAFAKGAGAREPVDPARVLAKIDYVYGASMLLSREFLETVGLLDEDYFLFFEEMDLAVRARGRFGLACAPDAVVFHRRGGSVDLSDAKAKAKQLFSKYHWNRSRKLFMRKHNPKALPGIYWRLVKNAVNALAKGDRDRARMLWAVVRDKPWTPDRP